MLDDDPLFVNSAGNDFHLLFSSPCRNTGDNSSVTEEYDFEGDQRNAYGIVDMGADEFYTHFYCIGDFTPSGTLTGNFVGLPGTNPVGLFFGSGVLDPPLQHKWGVFYLQAPWLFIPVGTSIPADGVLFIPATIPQNPNPPYKVFMQALIGLESDSFSNLFVLKVE